MRRVPRWAACCARVERAGGTFVLCPRAASTAISARARNPVACKSSWHPITDAIRQLAVPPPP